MHSEILASTCFKLFGKAHERHRYCIIIGHAYQLYLLQANWPSIVYVQVKVISRHAHTAARQIDACRQCACGVCTLEISFAERHISACKLSHTSYLSFIELMTESQACWYF